MLHDDVLEPFLVKLKCHIQSIHVCLGKIESWLVEPKDSISFLEDTFETKLSTDEGAGEILLKSCSDS